MTPEVHGDLPQSDAYAIALAASGQRSGWPLDEGDPAVLGAEHGSPRPRLGAVAVLLRLGQVVRRRSRTARGQLLTEGSVSRRP